MPYVELDGIATYYEVHGAGDPVLLLHGGFCSIETLQPQIDELALGYQVHAPERPGQGRTADRDGPISFDAMVRDTLAYLSALGVPAAHVIGFSDGAITGLLLARDHPERVRSLVAISANLDPTGFVEDDDATSGAGRRARARGPLAVPRGLPPAVAGRTGARRGRARQADDDVAVRAADRARLVGRDPRRRPWCSRVSTTRSAPTTHSRSPAPSRARSSRSCPAPATWSWRSARPWSTCCSVSSWPR